MTQKTSSKNFGNIGYWSINGQYIGIGPKRLFRSISSYKYETIRRIHPTFTPATNGKPPQILTVWSNDLQAQPKRSRKKLHLNTLVERQYVGDGTSQTTLPNLTPAFVVNVNACVLNESLPLLKQG